MRIDRAREEILIALRFWPSSISSSLFLKLIESYKPRLSAEAYRTLLEDLIGTLEAASYQKYKTNESVAFRWRDYADNNQVKIMTLKPEEFIRRFLSHVVPKGFMRIRFFGFLANACKKKNVDVIRKILKYQPTKKEETSVQSLMKKITGIDITLCPTCKKGKLQKIQTLLNKFSKTKFDTS